MYLHYFRIVSQDDLCNFASFVFMDKLENVCEKKKKKKKSRFILLGVLIKIGSHTSSKEYTIIFSYFQRKYGYLTMKSVKSALSVL